MKGSWRDFGLCIVIQFCFQSLQLVVCFINHECALRPGNFIPFSFLSLSWLNFLGGNHHKMNLSRVSYRMRERFQIDFDKYKRSSLKIINVKRGKRQACVLLSVVFRIWAVLAVELSFSGWWRLKNEEKKTSQNPKEDKGR